MIRPLLEFLIERARDEGRQPPAWLRWLARHDSRLHEHSQQAAALDRALKSGAVSRRHELDSKPNHFASRHKRVGPVPVFGSAARWGWLAATAAALAGVAAFMNHHNEQQARAAHAQLVSAQLTKVPDDLLRVIADVARKPREFSPLTRVNLPDVNLWSDIPRGTQGHLRESFSTWGSQLSDLGERVYQRFDLRNDTEMN